MDHHELVAMLPGRTWGSIRRQAVTVEMNRPIEMRTRLSVERRYTAEEDQVIRDFHNYMITREEMRRRLPERSDDSIQLRAHSLGFRKRKPHVTWRLVSTRQIPEGGEERGQRKGQKKGQNGAQNNSLEVVPNGSRSKTRSSPYLGHKGR